MARAAKEIQRQESAQVKSERRVLGAFLLVGYVGSRALFGLAVGLAAQGFLALLPLPDWLAVAAKVAPVPLAITLGVTYGVFKHREDQRRLRHLLRQLHSDEIAPGVWRPRGTEQQIRITPSDYHDPLLDVHGHREALSADLRLVLESIRFHPTEEQLDRLGRPVPKPEILRRWWAPVADGSGAEPPVGHFVALAPGRSDSPERRRRLRQPLVVVLEERSDGVYLGRFASDQENVGDTWHRSVAAARNQAAYEYPDRFGDWQEIPADVADSAKYALAQVR
ncbi:MAG: hypothetical protein HY329_18735 [Chloroflexi bacterium]|nr:hypothetical protein [Chloroflexota bacterium]